MRRSTLLSLGALVLGAILVSPPIEARDFTTKRSSVSKSSRHRSGPTLPSEIEERKRRYTPPEREPSELEEATEEYYRERADYYKSKREKSERRRSSGGTCMYGADGKLLYAPPGSNCGNPASPSR